MAPICGSLEDAILLQVIAKHGPEINAAAMKEMVGIENAIKEAMRYQPIVSGLYRRALQTFPLMGYQIPKVSLTSLKILFSLAALCGILKREVRQRNRAGVWAMEVWL